MEVGSFSCPIFSKAEFSENRVLISRSTIVLALTTDRQKEMNFVTSTSSKKKKKVGNPPSNTHSHQTMDKLKEIQERRNLWMNHAKNNNDNSRDEETVIARSHNFIPQKPSALPSSSSSTLPPVQSSNSSKYYSTSPASFQGNISAHTDQLLQQLTFKLTHHITENIKK